MNDAERRRLIEHEKHMSRPVRELFPLEERSKKTIKCRQCKTFFSWSYLTGKPRVFCSGECKLAWQREHSTPFRPSPPGAGGSGDGASGD